MKLAVLYSFILAILHSFLFFDQKIGISVFLFVITALLMIIHLLQKYEKIKNKKALLLTIPILLLSSTYFIFNNIMFNVLNIFVILLLFAIMLTIAIIGKLNAPRLFENFFGLYFGPIEELPNAAKEIKKCFVKEKKQDEENKKKSLPKQILKGILISLPLVVIVIVLLATADDMFEKIFEDILRAIYSLFEIETLYTVLLRIALIVILTLYFICIAIRIKNNQFANQKPSSIQPNVKVEGVTLATMITILNIIYLVFSVVQIVHLKTNTISNYANYARAGFFQLMIISFINFVLIIITKINKKEVEQPVTKYLKIMNVLMAIFTVIILISSIYRMALYEKSYGYTYLRLLVNFVQITELILIIPTILYILKEKFNVSKWYAIIILCSYIIVNFANVDYIIAKGNIDRYIKDSSDKKKIDLRYLEEHTSTDALIEVTRLLQAKDIEVMRNTKNYLRYEYIELKEEEKTMQNFNISKRRALKELEKYNLEFVEPLNLTMVNSNDNSNI